MISSRRTTLRIDRGITLRIGLCVIVYDVGYFSCPSFTVVMMVMSMTVAMSMMSRMVMVMGMMMMVTTFFVVGIVVMMPVM